MSAKIVLTIILVTSFTIVSSNNHYNEYLDFEFNIKDAACRTPSTPCTPTGKTCSEDCTSIEICINGQFCLMQNCTGAANSASYCTTDGTSFTCGTDKTRCPSTSAFQCGDAGPFPDAKNCSQFYCCNGLSDPEKPQPSACDAGLEFDGIVGQCTLSKQCSSSTFKDATCSPDKQCGVVSDNNAYIYYLCLDDGTGTASPFFFHCSSGSFDDSTCICNTAGIDIAAPTCPSSNNVTTSSTSTTTSTTTSTITTTVIPDTPSVSPSTTSSPTGPVTDSTSSPSGPVTDSTSSSTITSSSSSPSSSSSTTTSPISSSTTTSPYTNSPSTSTEGITTTESSVQTCEQVFEFYPTNDNNNCHYCLCTQELLCEIRDCLPGTYFNPQISRCVNGQCKSLSLSVSIYEYLNTNVIKKVKSGFQKIYNTIFN